MNKFYKTGVLVLSLIFSVILIGQNQVSAQSCGIIYVDPALGNDVTGNGQADNPYKSISKALTVSPSYVRVAKCASGCTETNVVHLINNVVIEGGYVRSGNLWNKSSSPADKTIITFSGSESVSGVRHIVAFKSDGKSNWSVSDMEIITSNVPSGWLDASNRGASNYGFLIINGSSDYNLSRLNITVGNASNGVNGSTPGSGGGSAGGNGGNGGAGCQRNCNPGVGGNGQVGAGVGSPVNSNGGNTGNPGSGVICYENSREGADGSNGANGYTGTTGALGSNYNISGSYFIPGGIGATGSPGGGGQGGGGGSGNVAGRNSCINCGVHTGGAGGKGGTGGRGGTGGTGGGGTFGIYRHNSGTGTNWFSVNIVKGTAGNGGSGALGSLGVAGNSGNEGACNGCVGKNTCAGNGGAGGTGGRGGTGGAGRAGLSTAIVTNGSSTTNLTNIIPYPSTVYVDNYTSRGFNMGKICNNSEIDLVKTSGTWVLPSGLTFVNDLTPSTSSSNTTLGAVKVTTNSANTFYDISNGQLLPKFLYVAPENRTLPNVQITPSSKVICIGGTVSLDKTNSYDAGNILEYEYVVYSDGSDANTPIYTSTATSYTTPAINTVGRYWVRYRELHSCCGWSRPVYDYFDVIDEPNAPVSLTALGLPACYTGTGTAVTLQSNATKAYSAYDSWELFDVNPTIGSPTPIATSTSNHPSFIVYPTSQTTYYLRGKNICDVSSAVSTVVNFSGDTTSNYDIVASNSSFICIVNDNNWHYFKNANNEIIAAINSNGQNLGNVTISTVLGNVGPFGTGGERCNGVGEYHVGRIVNVKAQNTHLFPVNMKLFFTNSEYSTHQTNTNLQSNFYKYCYGTTSNALDMTVSAINSSGTPDSINVLTKTVKSGFANVFEYEVEIFNLPATGTYTGGRIDANGVNLYIHNSTGLYSILPVEMTYFHGYYENLSNYLKWETASEMNNSHFDIERSEDGVNFEWIGKVDGHGTSYEPRKYQFEDNQAELSKVYYYRLKQTDRDGQYEYSSIIQILTPVEHGVKFGTLYPNPTQDQINLKIYTDESIQNSVLKIYNSTGQLVKEETLSLSEGMNIHNFNLKSLSAGTYLLNISSGQYEKTMQFVKIE